MQSVSFDVQTSARSEMVEVTDRVRRAVGEANLLDGIAVVYVPHTTAGVTVQENADPDVKRDFLGKLDRLFPEGEPFYRHAEGNSDSHLKASLVGSSATLVVEAGRVTLGRWQGVYLCEFDGPRTRSVIVKCVGRAKD